METMRPTMPCMTYVEAVKAPVSITFIGVDFDSILLFFNAKATKPKPKA